MKPHARGTFFVLVGGTFLPEHFYLRFLSGSAEIRDLSGNDLLHGETEE